VKQTAFEALGRSKIVRDYEAAFRQATGLSLKLVPAGMPEKRLELGSRENPFCALVTNSPGGCEACRKIQAEAQRRTGRKFAPHSVRCFAGLTDVAVPVVVGGEQVATLLGGQVLRRKPTRREFIQLTGFLIEWGLQTDLHCVEEAYFHTRVVTDEQFKSMVRLLTIFAQHLADSANRCLIAPRGGEPSAVARAKEFVRAHSTERVTMRQAAQHVHLSAFYFCKLFKKATGLTFTEYVARVRVEKAKNLLLNPALRVSEVAYAAGFQSIPHFNRVFRNYAGQSPTAYRASLSAPKSAK
jgi:AraC-like DNA-binding protein/ligand-binding sensor protein